MVNFISLLAAAIPVLAVLWAAVTDWRGMQISNRLVLGLAAMAPLWWFLQPIAFWPLAGHHTLLSIAILAAGFALFCARLVGAGDVKLLAALGLWLPASQWPTLLVAMALSGGVLALVAWALVRWPQLLRWQIPPKSWLGQLQAGTKVVPYGLAIAVGFALAWWPIYGQLIQLVLTGLRVS